MKVCVIGSGAFGIALASIANKNNVETTLWVHSKNSFDVLKKLI